MLVVVREGLVTMTKQGAEDFFCLIDLGGWDSELLDVLEDVKNNYAENAYQRQVINRLWQRADQVTSP